MSSSQIVVALVAVAAAISVPPTLALLRPRRRPSHRHPTQRSPISVSLERSTSGLRWRIDVALGAGRTSIDIISHRPSGTGEWTAEPLIEPILVDAGASTLLAATAAPGPEAHDVVVGWTQLGPHGPLQRSGTFHVSAPSARPVPTPAPMAAPVPERRSARPRIVPWLLGAGLLAAVLMAAAALTAPRGSVGDGDAIGPSPTTAAPSAATPSTDTSPDAGTDATSSASTPSTVSPVPPATNPGVPPVTAPIVSSGSPDDASVPTNDDAVPGPPRIDVFGQIEDCRYGADCLIVGFVLVDWTSTPTSYTCEFADGSRYTFDFGGDGVSSACAAAGDEPTVTIEVDGVRSATLTRSSFDAADG